MYVVVKMRIIIVKETFFWIVTKYRVSNLKFNFLQNFSLKKLVDHYALMRRIISFFAIVKEICENEKHDKLYFLLVGYGNFTNLHSLQKECICIMVYVETL